MNAHLHDLWLLLEVRMEMVFALMHHLVLARRSRPTRKSGLR